MTGAEFRATREALGATQQQLAEALGLDGGSRTVRYWEDGQRAISGPVARLVTLALTSRAARRYLGLAAK